MKKILLAILSIVLILASLFGLFSGVASLKDVLNIKDYKTADSETGLAAINDELKPGIQQLSENYNTYLDGVDTFEAGKAQYADGQAQLAAGAAQLAQGEKDLAAGKQQLADGYQQYNEGKALLDANTQAYNEGKEKIAMLESYMPMIEGIAQAAQNVRDFNAGIPFIGQTIDSMGGQLRSSVMNLLANSSAVSAISDMVGMDVGSLLASNPEDTSVAGNVVAMYYDGLAQLKQYEDGLAQLIAAEKQLADGEAAIAAGEAQLQQGYADYAAGEAQLADGAKQLAEGEAQLAQFEQGEVQLVVGLCRLLSQPSYEQGVGQVYPADEVPEPIFQTLVGNIEESDRDAIRAAIYPGFWDTEDQSKWSFPVNEGEGKEVCPSVLDILRGEDYLGESFNPASDLFMKNDDGSVKVANGYPVVNLYVADKIADAGLDYINKYQAAAVTHEVLGKLISTALLLVGSVAGLLAGLFGLLAVFGKATGAAKTFGIISFLSALAGVIVALVMGLFKGAAFGVSDGAINPWGHIIDRLPDKKYLLALIILAAAALLFCLVASAVRRAVKKAKKAAAQPVYAAAPQPVAQPVYAEPVVAQPVVAQPVVTEPVVEKVAEPVYVAPAAAVSAAEAYAAEAQKAAAEAKAAAAIGDVAAAERAAAAAAAAAEAAAKAAAAE